MSGSLYTHAQRVEVFGKSKQDTTWSEKVYVSKISDFNQMFTASYEILLAEGDIDSAGTFRIVFPATQQETLYRLHRIKKGDPVSTLIIGSKDENHVFFIAKASQQVELKCSNDDRILDQDLVSGTGANEALKSLFQIVNNDTLNRELMKEALITVADTASSELVSLLAVHHMFTLNGSQKDRVTQIIGKLNKQNPYGSRIFEAYRTVSYLPVFILVTVTIMAGGVFMFRTYKRRIASKIIDTLSQREMDVARLMLTAKTNKEIAAKLNIELSTVKTHVNNIYTKLKIDSRKDLMIYKHVLESGK